MKFIVYCSLLLCSFIFNTYCTAYGSEAVSSEIVRKASADIKSIAIISKQPAIGALATKAFKTHGAFSVLNAATVNFKLYLESITAGAIKITIEGAQGQKLFEQIVRGASETEALYRACDLAVLKLTGAPGYFSGKLTFVCAKNHQNELYAGDILFQSVKQLTHDRSEPLMPAWSSDGTAIVYTTYFKSGFPDLYKIDLTTGKRTVFAAYKGINAGAAFNPVTHDVAMILSSAGSTELYLSGPTGTHPKRITHSKSVKASPAWSADGKRLVLTSDEIGGPQLFEVMLPGGKLQRIPTNISRYCAQPTWNPKSPNLIAFTATIHKRFQIGVYDSATGTSMQLTQDPRSSSLDPCWTNDGRHLICTRQNGDQRQLFIVDTQSGKETALHSAPFGSCCQAAFTYQP